MRFICLGLMATSWVLSPVRGQKESSQLPYFTTVIERVGIETGTSTQSLNISIKISNASTTNTTLFLCQATTNEMFDNVFISAQRLGSYCAGTSNDCKEENIPKGLDGVIENEKGRNITITMENKDPPVNSHFFLCFTNADGFCASTSRLNISKYTSEPPPTDEVGKLITDRSFQPTHHLSNTNPKVVGHDGDLLPGQTSVLSSITVTATPIPAPTADVSSTPDATPTLVPSNGLSTAAKAGIAIAALGVASIILLGILLCLRKRHRHTKPSDQIMLNQSSADSHDLITEKEAERNPPSYEAPTQVYSGALNIPPKPQTPTRHSALSPYEEIPEQPYTGSAAAIPRRKPTISANHNVNPTNNIAVISAAAGPSPSSPIALSPTSTISPISREVSAASTIGPPSRNNLNPNNDSTPPIRNFEEYRDVPTNYAERHTPQVYEGVLKAPFLGSESNSRGSMSEADIERLTEEEEERRIDAAIEEAERLKSGKGR